MTDIDFDAAIEILGVNAFGPAIPEFLRHGASGERKPSLVEPDPGFVFAGHPDHHRGSVHRLAETGIQSAGWLHWNMKAHFNHGLIPYCPGSMSSTSSVSFDLVESLSQPGHFERSMLSRND